MKEREADSRWHGGYAASRSCSGPCCEGPLFTLGEFVCVSQGMGGRHTAMDPAGVQHTQHQDGCSAPAGTAGPEAAAETGQGDRDLPCAQGTLLSVFW